MISFGKHTLSASRISTYREPPKCGLGEVAYSRAKASSVASRFVPTSRLCQTLVGHKPTDSCREITWKAEEYLLL